MDKQEEKDEDKQVDNTIKDNSSFRPPTSVYGMNNMASSISDIINSEISYTTSSFSYITPAERIIMAIDGHRYELEDIGIKLAKVAQRYTIISLFTKVLVIFLGAFIATKEVANQILGTSNAGNIVIYAATGLLIATATGLEVAFKWENRSAELRTLVATCRTTTRKISSDLAKLPSRNAPQGNYNEKELNRILDSLDCTLADIQTKASSLGIDTTKYRDAITNNNST